MKNAIWISILVFLTACQLQQPKKKRKQVAFGGEAQGTTYTVKYIGEEVEDLPRQMDSLLKAIDVSMSTYLESSTIVRLNEGDSAVVDEMFVEVFELSQRMKEETEGAFDPTLAPVIEAWGFDYSQPQQMDSAKVDSLLAFCGFEQFELDGKLLRKKTRGAKLNFNAVAQGYSVDLMADLLRAKNISDYYVELGGEVIVGGLNQDSVPWRIGIDKPQGRNLERELSAIVSLEDKAMVTSGNYRKFVEVEGEKYSHSIDPKSGFPVKHNLLSATIIADDAGVADAIATACMVMGLEKCQAFLARHQEYEAILIYSNGDGKLNIFISESLVEKVEELE